MGRNVLYEAGHYELREKEAVEKISDYPDIRLLPIEDEDGVYSEFGTPVFGSIKFEVGEYNTYSRKTGAVEKVTIDSYALPYSCIVSFSRNSNITKTEVLGSTGTVKGIYEKGDWDVTVRGIAMAGWSGEGLTAQEQINRLVKCILPTRCLNN
jgi:hypothetical protein